MSSQHWEWPTIGVIPFCKCECPPSPTSGPPLFTWQQYYRFRNSILNVLSKHGSVGPEGQLPILQTWELSDAAWEMGTSSPDFFVISDLYNYWNRWNRVEAEPWLVNADLLRELVALLMSGRNGVSTWH